MAAPSPDGGQALAARIGGRCERATGARTTIDELDRMLVAEAAVERHGRHEVMAASTQPSPLQSRPLVTRGRVSLFHADPELTALPFLMITAQNRDDRVALAHEAGVNGYVVKPFNADTLGRQIARAIGG